MDTPTEAPPNRFAVVGPGLLLGAALAFHSAFVQMPSGMDAVNRLKVWAAVMGGPVYGTSLGWLPFGTFLCVGWLGLFLIPCHPLRPGWATACLSALGLVLWFFAGYLAVIGAVFGA